MLGDLEVHMSGPAEIRKVAQLLVDTTRRILPQLQPRKKTRMRDDTLSRLCAVSRAAWRAWKEAGCPTVGSLYERKCDLRRQLRANFFFGPTS